jgi:hypothetical protein
VSLVSLKEWDRWEWEVPHKWSQEGNPGRPNHHKPLADQLF